MSYIIPTINRDGSISEVEVDRPESLCRIITKIPVTIPLEVGSIVNIKIPYTEYILHRFKYNLDELRYVHVYVYVDVDFQKDNEKRYDKIERVVNDKIQWFFSYGQRIEIP
jgi:hypothetical protein